MKDTQIIMLGTGNAGVTRCYNTCFAIRTAENVLLVDAGGGNGILVQLEKAGIAIERIHDMFVTHAHTDHILGAGMGNPDGSTTDAKWEICRRLPGIWT